MACVSVPFQPSEEHPDQRFAPTPRSAVQLLRARPQRLFVIIGELQATVTGFPSRERIVEPVIEKAAAIGAGAILPYADLGPTGDAPDGYPESRTALALFYAIRFPR